MVANAGLAGGKTVLAPADMPWQITRDIFQINLLGAIATFTPFLRPMLQRGRGQLVAISSLSADIGIAPAAAYCASKAGLTQYMQALDQDLRPRGVPVTLIHPGFVRTPAIDDLQTAMPMMFELDDALDIIERAITGKRRLTRFPWILGLLYRLVWMLPGAVRDPMIRLALSAASKSGK